MRMFTYVCCQCLPEVLLNCKKNVLVLLLGSGYHLQDVHNDHVQCTKK